MTFVDVETTGGSYRRDRIIEIALIQTEDGKITSTFQSLINPEQRVPESILEMTGVIQAELEKAPTFSEVVQEVGELLADSVFVAHNAAFDYGFVKNEFRLLEKNYSAKCLCTVKLSRALFPSYRSHSLDSLIKRFGFEVNNRHRAYDDAKVMVDFFDLVKSQFEPEKIEKAVSAILKRPSIPVRISEKKLNSLHEGPGVYIFYGDTGIPLYIGKSVSVRDRVLSHFSASSFSSTELNIASQIKDIEVIKTEGELGALLKESELIKRMLPVYNKRLRVVENLAYIKGGINSQGYKTIFLTTDALEEGETLGIFKTQKQAKDRIEELCEKHRLCKKLLGLEKSHTKGQSCCFGHHLGKCKGACVGEEPAKMYNLRFDMAFVETKLKSWPFKGPVLITEGDSAVIVDNWVCKSVETNISEVPLGKEGLPDLSGLHETKFDLDTYKILSSYIFSKKNQKNIKVM